MNKLIHYIALCGILFTACSEETLPKDPPVSSDGKEVEVILNLTPQPLQTPVPTTKSNAGSGNPNVLASSHGGAMDLELLAEQPGATTRDGAAGDTGTGNTTSPATDAEKYIDNVWIFLFDGPTSNNPKLIKKLYKSTYQSDQGMKLIKKGGENDKQLLVVLANSFDPTLAKSLTADENGNGSQYSALQNLYSTIEIFSPQQIPMVGTIEDKIPTTSTETTTITVPMTHIAAKITMSVKLGDTFPNGQWTAQICNVAPTYWFPTVESTTTFPTNDKTFSFQKEENITLDNKGTDFKEFTWYVPMNLRGTISNAASISGANRVTNAPKQATYIRLTHNSEEGNKWTQRDYYIHLGANFTNDYNVRRNTHYIYKVTLYTNAEEDSRINNSTTIYVGRFGGDLKETYEGSGVWQFTKELWVGTTDEEKSAWNDGTVTDFKNYFTGKENTWSIKKNYSTSAAMQCFKKNVGYTNIVSQEDPAYQWYLPALNQLLGIWEAKNSFGDGISFKSDNYWSATDFSAYNTDRTWNANINSGLTSCTVERTVQLDIRCVKERESKSN